MAAVLAYGEDINAGGQRRQCLSQFFFHLVCSQRIGLFCSRPVFPPVLPARPTMCRTLTFPLPRQSGRGADKELCVVTMFLQQSGKSQTSRAAGGLAALDRFVACARGLRRSR